MRNIVRANCHLCLTVPVHVSITVFEQLTRRHYDQDQTSTWSDLSFTAVGCREQGGLAMTGCDGMRNCVTVVWEVLEIDLYMTGLDSALSSAQRASSVTV